MNLLIPWVLASFRLVSAPLFPLGAYLGAPGWSFSLLLFLGLISDIYDGILARKLGMSTLKLRRFDSNCDTVFYSLATLTVVTLRVTTLHPWSPAIYALVAVILFRNLVDWLRYRAQPSYHMYSGKLWGIVIFITLSALFMGASGITADLCIGATIGLGFINTGEAIIASLMLTKPRADIPTVYHAWKLAIKEEGRTTDFVESKSPSV
jgi:CDP-diacylglycerol--glycerol-3-phosphate 3-phosphatidyltransferase